VGRYKQLQLQVKAGPTTSRRTPEVMYMQAKNLGMGAATTSLKGTGSSRSPSHSHHSQKRTAKVPKKDPTKKLTYLSRTGRFAISPQVDTQLAQASPKQPGRRPAGR